MALQQLTLETLGHLDAGTVSVLVNRELARMVEDLEDRGSEDEKTRKVVIEVEATLKKGLVVVQVKCQAKLPAVVSGGTVAEIRMGNRNQRGLAFSSNCPDNPAQKSIYDEIEEPEQE